MNFPSRSRRTSVCFVLPGYSRRAIGGYKIVYEYANRLPKNKYAVFIFYSQFSKLRRYSLYGFLARIYPAVRFLHAKMTKRRWFPLEDVKELLRFSYNKKTLARFDVLVATAIETAFALHDLELDKAKSCIYLIQDFENWEPIFKARVFESYRFPMKKICIAPWLVEKVRSVGEDAALIYNGLDFSYFTLTRKIEDRNPLEISVMYYECSTRSTKRFEDSAKALEIVREQFPRLHVSVFGVFKDPGDFPAWFTYHRSPSKDEHNAIYNNAAIYIAASSSEGFGLTVAEAMMCGCAVACTDNGGFSSMVTDGETGLLSPVFDYEALARNVVRLISDADLRIRLARNGNESVRKFNWETAVEKFRAVIEDEQVLGGGV